MKAAAAQGGDPDGDGNDDDDDDEGNIDQNNEADTPHVVSFIHVLDDWTGVRAELTVLCQGTMIMGWPLLLLCLSH